MSVGCQLSRLPDKLEHGDEASQTHSGEKHDEDAADVGQTQFISFTRAVIVFQ